MASGYRGVFLIGNKAANRITDVQVVDAGGNTIPLPFAEYVARGAEPNYKTLPWQEDVEAKQAEPKPQVPSLSHVVTYRGAATDNWSPEETDDPLHADRRNFTRSRGGAGLGSALRRICCSLETVSLRPSGSLSASSRGDRGRG